MNPARKMWKTLNQDRFVRRSGLKHAVLDPSLSSTAIGDLTLLASPFMFPVRLTRKMTVEDSRFLADGRQLILSSFPSNVPVFPVNYDNCHLMNARNEALCRRATGEEEG